MDNMTLEHLAALIIVSSFFGVLGSIVGHAIGQIWIWTGEKKKAWREKRGKEKTDGDTVEQ